MFLYEDELRKNDNWRKSMITNRRNIEGNDEEMQNQELTRAKGKGIYIYIYILIVHQIRYEFVHLLIKAPHLVQG